jgi:hypothetical protein
MPKPRALKAPTYEYILALRTELEALYADQDESIRRVRKAAEMTAPVHVPEELRIVDVTVQDPTVADERQRVTASLTINPIKVTCVPASQNDKAQENATLREKFSEEVLRVAGTRLPGANTLTQAVDACIGDGGAWTKFLLTKDVWEERYGLKLEQFEQADDDDADDDEKRPARTPAERKMSAEARYNKATEEAKKAAGPPFTWVCCDSLAVYPVRRAGKLAEIIEVDKRPASSTFREYRLARDKQGDIVPEEYGEGAAESSGATGDVTVIQHWDATFASVIVVGARNDGTATGRVVQQWRHRYGRVPYFYAPGITYAHWRNRKVGWSVSETKRSLVEYRSFLFTVHANAVARDTFAPVAQEQDIDPAQGLIGADAKPKGTAPVERWNLREIVKLNPGQRIVPFQFPSVSQSLREEIAIVSQAIDQISTPRINSIGGSEMGSGFAINQVLAEARIRHDPQAQAIGRMVTEVVKFAWHIIRHVVKERVWVYSEYGEGGWLSASPDDLTDTVAVSASLDPERPSAKLIEARYWHERVKEGSASQDQAIEAMGDNPDEVRQGRAMDRMRASAWYVKLQDSAVLQESGMGDLLEQAQAVAANGVFPGQMVGGDSPAAMGSQQVPDMGALAVSPNGAGAAPMGPSNGSVVGSTPGAVVPTQGAAVGIQSLGG